MGRLLSSLLATVTAAALCACDPAGPGASGTLSLKTGVDPSRFNTLQIRVFPDAAPSFDPATLPAKRLLSGRAALSEITFPHRYEVEESIGTTPQRDWRLLAWLSTSTGAPDHPDAGEPWCTVPFVIGECDGFDDYCGVTRGVDCTLE